MGLIHLPYPSQQKPPLGSQINWSHPLSRGLVGCWLMNEGGGKFFRENISRRLTTLFNPAQYNGKTWGVTPRGIGVSANQGTGPTYPQDPNYKITNQVTLVDYSYYPNAITGVTPIFEKANGYLDGTGYQIFSGYSQDADLVFQVQGTRAVSPGKVMNVAGSFHLIVGTYDGSNIKIYSDGILLKTQAYSNSSLTDSAVGLRFRSGGSRIILYSLAYNRALSPAEIQQLYAEPYEFIQKRKIYIIGVGGSSPSASVSASPSASASASPSASVSSSPSTSVSSSPSTSISASPSASISSSPSESPSASISTSPSSSTSGSPSESVSASPSASVSGSPSTSVSSSPSTSISGSPSASVSASPSGSVSASPSSSVSSSSSVSISSSPSSSLSGSPSASPSESPSASPSSSISASPSASPSASASGSPSGSVSASPSSSISASPSSSPSSSVSGSPSASASGAPGDEDTYFICNTNAGGDDVLSLYVDGIEVARFKGNGDIDLNGVVNQNAF